MHTLKTFFRLVAPFWRSRQQWRAWLLLGCVIAMGLLIVRINVLLNEWSKTFYDALGEYRTDALYALLSEYALYLGLFVLVMVYKDWLRKALILHWRQAMTMALIEQWLGGQAFYRLGFNAEPDNPDQRIAEDVDLLVNHSVDLLVSFIINLAQGSAFAMILWQLSGVQRVEIAGLRLSIEGWLVWVAVGYTLLCCAITHMIGRPLKQLNYRQQQCEADFRASLLRKREHAEQIALYRGEAVEARQLDQRFRAIAGNWRALMDRERTLGFFTNGYNRFNLMIPIFAALPAFLAKTITLGGLMQIRSAFGAVQGSISWFIFAYRQLAEWSATVQRLDQFQRAIEASREQVREPIGLGPELVLQDLRVLRPDGSPLLAPLNVRVRPGVWLRLAGRSGLGKSTLLRTLHGLWPFYQGTWQLPRGRSLLLPQQPYLASAPLAQLLAYPDTRIPPDSELIAVLERVGLGHCRDQLQRDAEWSRELSGGEQQRLSLARALLYRPDTLYLDEATNQLDEASAGTLLRQLRDDLPATTVIAISHQPLVQGLFEHIMTLRSVRDVPDQAGDLVESYAGGVGG